MNDRELCTSTHPHCTPEQAEAIRHVWRDRDSVSNEEFLPRLKAVRARTPLMPRYTTAEDEGWEGIEWE